MINNSMLMRGALRTECGAQCSFPYLTLPTLTSIHGGAPPPAPEKAQLQRLLENGPVEVRALGDGKNWSGVFDNYADMRRELIYLCGLGVDVYNTINPVSAAVTNNVKPYRRAIRNQDVSYIACLPFDFDPIREKGVAATDEQVDLARGQADKLISFLGWGEPLIGMSGNGWHVLYETHMPHTVETERVLKTLYLALSLRFSTDAVNFDVVVRNSARIMRTYGSVNTKSGRRSYCIAPQARSVVLEDTIRDLAHKLMPEQRKRTWVKTAAPETTGKGYVKNLDIAGLFASYGLYIRETNEANKHWVICPWEGEHGETGETDTVIWEGVWPQFHCSHDHCSHRNILDVINLLGGGK